MIKAMVSSSEKTPVSLDLLASPKFDCRPLVVGLGETYYRLNGNGTPLLLTVDVGAVLEPKRSFCGHYSSHNSSLDLVVSNLQKIFRDRSPVPASLIPHRHKPPLVSA